MQLSREQLTELLTMMTDAGMSVQEADAAVESVKMAQTFEDAKQMVADEIAIMKGASSSSGSKPPAPKTPPAASAPTGPSEVEKEITIMLAEDRAMKHFTVEISTQIDGNFYHIGEVYVWDDAVVKKLGPNAKPL